MEYVRGGLVRTARATRLLAALLLVLSVGVNLANILGRYFLDAPLVWGEEVMAFLMVGFVFLGAVAISAAGRHIRMDMLLALLPRPARRVGEAATILAEAAAAGLAAWLGWPVVAALMDFDQRADASGLPMWIPQAIVPVGLALILLVCLGRLALLAGERPR